MKFINGLWHYRGRTYTTLRAALLAAWLLPRRADKTGSADKISR